MTTWLSDLKDHEPCTDGYRWAKENNIASLAEAFAKLERSDWWLWLARAYGIDLDKPRLVTFAADCAERVLPKFEERYPDDKRPRQAIDAARAWVTCPSPETRANAAYAAYAAANAANAAYDAYAAYYAAAYAAVANAAYAAYYAAVANAAYAADERSWQADRLRKLFPEVTK